MPNWSARAELSPPALAGGGARFQHLGVFESLQSIPSLLEFHTENLFGLQGPVARRIDNLRCRSEFSLHCVGLSLGSAKRVDPLHLEKVRLAVNRYQPLLVSDHACWNSIDSIAIPDLFPVPLNKAALNAMASNVDHVQSVLGRQLIVENLTFYMRFEASTLDEPQFLTELCQRTGCGLLVDINNLEMNRRNFGVDPVAYLQCLREKDVVEYHLAGGVESENGWIDTHSRPVDEPTWRLYRQALDVLGPRHTVVEWDQELPEATRLVEECTRVADILDAWTQAVAV